MKPKRGIKYDDRLDLRFRMTGSNFQFKNIEEYYTIRASLIQSYKKSIINIVLAMGIGLTLIFISFGFIYFINNNFNFGIFFIYFGIMTFLLTLILIKNMYNSLLRDLKRTYIKIEMKEKKENE